MNPYPVHDPRHNLRELVKECLLIERHLFDPSKYCEDCIRKHFLTIEAFAGEELVSLDVDQEYTDAINLLVLSVPNWQSAWTGGYDPRTIAQEIRKIRKRLSPACFDSEDLQSVLCVDKLLYNSGMSNTVAALESNALALEAQNLTPSTCCDGVGGFEVVCPHCEQILIIGEA